MLKVCSECGQQMSDRAPFCLNCGYREHVDPLPVHVASGLRRPGLARQVVAGLIVLGCVLFIVVAAIGNIALSYIWDAIIVVLLALIWAAI